MNTHAKRAARRAHDLDEDEIALLIMSHELASRALPETHQNNEQLAQLRSCLQYMKETGAPVFREEQFRLWRFAHVVENEALSGAEKLRQVTALLAERDEVTTVS